MSETNALAALSDDVVRARQAESALRQIVAASKRAWDEDNRFALELLSHALEAREEAEALLKIEALRAWEVTGSKKPASGVGIRVVTRLSYALSDAVAWAKEHDMALKLDIVEFERIAKAAGNLPFVQETEAITVTLSPSLALTEEATAL